MRRAARVDGQIWTCACCGLSKPATVHLLRNKTCSAKCANDLRGRLSDKERICQSCGGVYKRKKATKQKYCSYACFGAALRKSKENDRLVTKCCWCSKEFVSSPSQGRKYCSYDCHLKSGGAVRAGMASKVAVMKYGAKKDANHKEIFEVIEKFCAVYDFSSAGCGIPDGAAYINDGWHLFDVKNPKTGYGRRGLNKTQKKWVSVWRGGPVYLIYTPGQAKEFAMGNFADLKVVTPEIAAAELEKEAAK